MPTIGEYWIKFWRSLTEMFASQSSSRPSLNASNGTQGRPVGPGLKDEVIKFSNFIAVRLPQGLPSSLARGEVLQIAASEIASKVGKALKEAGMEEFNLLELYLPGDTANIINNIFGRESGGLKQFARICETDIFGGPTAGRRNDTPRVHVIDRKLDFHQAFDPILDGRLIARPLGAGQTFVPLEPEEADFGKDQLLVGLFQVYGLDQTLIDEAPIWAWRAGKDQNKVEIDVDFDMMTRAFRDKSDRHKFPLGLAIRCGFRQSGGARLIDTVSIDITGAKKWNEYLEKMYRGEEVTYYIGTGGGRSYEKYALKDHTLNSIEVNREDVVDEFYLGIDDKGNERKIPINRNITLYVKAKNTSYLYAFGFFERALNYVPARNIMRVTGQLVPAGEPTDVMLPPGTDGDQLPIFRLTPTAGQPGRFRLRVLDEVTQNVTLNHRSLAPGDEVDVEIDDEVQVVPQQRLGDTPEPYRFNFQELSGIPREVLERGDRRYSAFIEVSPPQGRQFILSGDHVFGRGYHFHEDIVGVETVALKFARPWVFLKMLPGRGQDVHYLNIYAKKNGSGPGRAERLGPEGVELDLNAIYYIYLGDFRITLNLKATPSSSYI